MRQEIDRLPPLEVGANREQRGRRETEKVREQRPRLRRGESDAVPRSTFPSFSAAVSSGAHHDGAGVEPDAHGKHGAVRTPGRRHLHEPERRPRGELGRVVVGLRPAEVDQYPVAEILRPGLRGGRPPRPRASDTSTARPASPRDRAAPRAPSSRRGRRRRPSAGGARQRARGRARVRAAWAFGARALHRCAPPASRTRGRTSRWPADPPGSAGSGARGTSCIRAEPRPGGIRMATEGARHRVAQRAAYHTAPPPIDLTTSRASPRPASRAAASLTSAVRGVASRVFGHLAEKSALHLRDRRRQPEALGEP